MCSTFLQCSQEGKKQNYIQESLQYTLSVCFLLFLSTGILSIVFYLLLYYAVLYSPYKY